MKGFWEATTLVISIILSVPACNPSATLPLEFRIDLSVLPTLIPLEMEVWEHHSLDTVKEKEVVLQ